MIILGSLETQAAAMSASGTTNGYVVYIIGGSSKRSAHAGQQTIAREAQGPNDPVLNYSRDETLVSACRGNSSTFATADRSHEGCRSGPGSVEGETEALWNVSVGIHTVITFW